MIFSLTTISIITAKMAFFWPTIIMGESQEDHDRWIEEFLVNDNFRKETVSDVENSLLLKLLEQLKGDYRINYYGKIEEIASKKFVFSYSQLDRIFKYNRIQIMRLRLVIQPDSIISINKTYNREQKYSVMRGYWINDAGKKILKFSASLGNTDNVLTKSGVYDYSTIKSAEKEIRSKLLNAYIQTYGDIRI